MDPKKMPNLDPKLKEIYDRVMNTDISSSIVTSIPGQNVSKDNNSQASSNTASQSTPPPPAQQTANTQTNAELASAPKPAAPATSTAQSSSTSSSFSAPTVPAPSASSAPSSTTKSFATFNASHLKSDPSGKSSAKAGHAAVAAAKGQSSLMPVIIFIGGTIFFIIYALFWIKFFGFQLPFLSSFF